MKKILFIVFVAVFVAVGHSSPTSTQEPIARLQKSHLLGSKECTYGPGYWCRNLTNAAACHATKHCIQTVWIHQKLPPDHSSICETCLKMVKEARDQLLSNETQEEIKEVFEGSCRLIPIRIIADECCKIADEFAPELIDTLASQMNPQIVCSVAGLCNSDRVHDLLAEESRQHKITAKKSSVQLNTCEGCHKVIEIVENKFHKASRDEILQGFLQVCGKMGSLSDGCSNIILTYFNDIYMHLEQNLNPTQFCLLSGECSAMFHTHANVEVIPMANTGVIHVSDDDLPCELCKQLVRHLQDVLIANTTESEFHMVLLGICKQTKSFKEQCISFVDQYFPQIYDFLVNELNGSVLCSLVSVCPGPGLMLSENIPIMPLLPVDKTYPLEKAEPVGPLPIERIMPQTLTMIGNTQLCEFCTYFLHYVQQAITDPMTEEKLEEVVERACKILPSAVTEECEEFVKTYGPAFIAILAHDIDPSTVCPKLSLCPSTEMHKIHNVEVFITPKKGPKPNCPLCLFAITSLEELIKNKKTEDTIRKGLEMLCSHLNGAIADECNDFVETYTEEIVTLMLKEISPQGVCTYLRLCENKVTTEKPYVAIGGKVDTNEIIDYTANGKVVTETKVEVNADVCMICEFVLSEIQNKLKDNSTEEEIKDMLNKLCNDFSSNYIKTHCLDFVRQYEDLIVQFLISNLSPSDVCKALHLCQAEKREPLEVTDLMIDYGDAIESFDTQKIKSPQCALCKIIMVKIEQMLNGSIDEDTILKSIEKVCTFLPSAKKKDCNQFIEQYGKQMLEFLKFALEPAEFCSIAGLCSSHVIKLEIRKCAVCEVAVDTMVKILQNPNVDKSLEHIFEKTCRAFPTKNQEICRTLIEVYGEKIFAMLATSMKPNEICREIKLCSSQTYRPNGPQLLGSKKCTWGPGYWCQSEITATECGAMDHCRKKIWSQQISP